MADPALCERAGLCHQGTVSKSKEVFMAVRNSILCEMEYLEVDVICPA